MLLQKIRIHINTSTAAKVRKAKRDQGQVDLDVHTYILSYDHALTRGLGHILRRIREIGIWKRNSQSLRKWFRIVSEIIYENTLFVSDSVPILITGYFR
jgi:hypothetical protein